MIAREGTYTEVTIATRIDETGFYWFCVHGSSHLRFAAEHPDEPVDVGLRCPGLGLRRGLLSLHGTDRGEQVASVGLGLLQGGRQVGLLGLRRLQLRRQGGDLVL